jgi:DNA-binding transcriptional LysR family regulator
MDGPHIDLLTLRGFCILMEERSVSRAAFRLGVKQPMMSRMLAKLRAYFEDSLLVWSGGHMVPTPRALVLDNEVRAILATMARISSPVQSFDPLSSRFTFKLVATGHLESTLLASVMAVIAARAPGIQVEVRPPDRFHDTSALEKGEIDFLVGWTVPPTPSLRSRLLFTDKLVCIARAGHPELRDGNLTYEKYVNLDHVQFDIRGRTTTELLLHDCLAKNGHQAKVKFRVQNFLTVAEIVANSDLIATVSNRFAITALTQFSLKAFEPPVRLPPMQNRVFWHERMHADPCSSWFRKLLADTAKRSDGLGRVRRLQTE